MSSAKWRPLCLDLSVSIHWGLHKMAAILHSSHVVPCSFTLYWPPVTASCFALFKYMSISCVNAQINERPQITITLVRHFADSNHRFPQHIISIASGVYFINGISLAIHSLAIQIRWDIHFVIPYLGTRFLHIFGKYQNTSVVPCAEFRNDDFVRYGMKGKRNFHRIWFTTYTSLLKRAVVAHSPFFPKILKYVCLVP